MYIFISMLAITKKDIIFDILQRLVLIEAYKITLEFLLQCKDKPATVKREDKTGKWDVMNSFQL